VPGPEQGSTPEYQNAFLQMIPLPRLGQADDIARGIAFLASDDAPWITGEVLHIDGGFLAGRPLPRNMAPAPTS
jgi:3-oxoacyl-[acyl-carrier protein] reductase